MCEIREERPVSVCISVSDRSFAFSLARALAAAGRFSIVENGDDCEVNISDSGTELVITPRDGESVRLPAVTDALTIASYLYELAGAIVHGEHTNGVKLLIFRAIRGGEGTTSIAAAACRLLSREYGRKPLFLSLSSFNMNMFTMSVPDDRSFAELLYRIRTESLTDLGRFILNGEETDYVRVPEVNINAGGVRADDVIRIAKLAAEKGYDRLIIDSGTLWNRERGKLVGCSDITVNVGFINESGINVGRDSRACERGDDMHDFDILVDNGDMLDETAMFADFANDVAVLVRKIEEKIG